MGKVLKYDEKIFLSKEDGAILDETLERIVSEQSPKGDRRVGVIFSAVRDQIAEFCRRDMEFCRAVHGSGKNVSECCSEIVKDVSTGISDIEIYRRAVKFFLPHADVIAQITIVTHDAGKPEFPVARSRVLNLWDL